MLAAVKAHFGHTEGAAGLTGVALAMGMLTMALAPGVAGLTTLNPYVAAVLPGGRAVGIPRQAAPGCDGGRLAGTSSFGMSGVNAHALLALPSPGGVCGAEGGPDERARRGALACEGVPWAATPHHLCPMPVSLLAGVGVGRGKARFACALASPRLAWLHDHALQGERLSTRVGWGGGEGPSTEWSMLGMLAGLAPP